MTAQKASDVHSIEQLIASLEHIEVSELQSDVRENMRAELKRMKANISAILSFVSYSAVQRSDNVELRNAVHEIQRECLLINGMISKALLLQTLRLSESTWVEYTSLALAHYRKLAQAANQMCLLISPQLSEQLSAAF